MKVSKKQPDALNYKVTVDIAAADYAEPLHKRLNEYKRKAAVDTEFKAYWNDPDFKLVIKLY
jgi:hypothetical protein